MPDDNSLIKLKIQKRGGVIQSYWVTEKTANEKYIYSQKKDAFIRYQRTRKISIQTPEGKETVTHEKVKYLYRMNKKGEYEQARKVAPGDRLAGMPRKMPKHYQIEITWKAGSRYKGKVVKTTERSYSDVYSGKSDVNKATAEAESRAEEQAMGWHTTVTGEGGSKKAPDTFAITGVKIVAWVS